MARDFIYCNLCGAYIKNINAVEVEFTNQEKVEFSNCDKAIKHPFIIYADFGSRLELLHTCQPNPKRPFYNPTQKHTIYSFCVYAKCKEYQYSN